MKRNQLLLILAFGSCLGLLSWLSFVNYYSLTQPTYLTTSIILFIPSLITILSVTLLKTLGPIVPEGPLLVYPTILLNLVWGSVLGYLILKKVNKKTKRRKSR